MPSKTLPKSFLQSSIIQWDISFVKIQRSCSSICNPLIDHLNSCKFLYNIPIVIQFNLFKNIYHKRDKNLFGVVNVAENYDFFTFWAFLMSSVKGKTQIVEIKAEQKLCLSF